MNPADLIQELRARRYAFSNEAGEFALDPLCQEAADSLASKDAALAEIRAEYLNASHDAMKLAAELALVKTELARVSKALVIANAQLADMEFLSIEGFMGWKQDRASRAISQDGEERST